MGHGAKAVWDAYAKDPAAACVFLVPILPVFLSFSVHSESSLLLALGELRGLVTSWRCRVEADLCERAKGNCEWLCLLFDGDEMRCRCTFDVKRNTRAGVDGGGAVT